MSDCQGTRWWQSPGIEWREGKSMCQAVADPDVSEEDGRGMNGRDMEGRGKTGDARRMVGLAKGGQLR